MATTDPAQPIAGGGSRPVPDPTELTDRAIAKLKEQMEQYIEGQVAVLEQRLAGMDTAVKLAQAGVEKMPDQMDEKLGGFEKVVATKFDGIATQLKERDERAAREAQLGKDALDAAFSASKEAVAAALTAQKEAAAEQNKSNTLAISKSEAASQETINKLEVLFRAGLDAIADKVDDLKDRVGRQEASKVGAIENRTGIYAAVGIIGTILGIVIAAAAVIAILSPGA